MPTNANWLWPCADSYAFMEKVHEGMPPVIICVACNGGVQGEEYNETIPETADEIADSVYDAYQAGASMVHIHARRWNGVRSLIWECPFTRVSVEFSAVRNYARKRRERNRSATPHLRRKRGGPMRRNPSWPAQVFGGSTLSGFPVGILTINTSHALLPGNVQNAQSFCAPPIYEEVTVSDHNDLMRGEPRLLAPIIMTLLIRWLQEAVHYSPYTGMVRVLPARRSSQKSKPPKQ